MEKKRGSQGFLKRREMKKGDKEAKSGGEGGVFYVKLTRHYYASRMPKVSHNN